MLLLDDALSGVLIRESNVCGSLKVDLSVFRQPSVVEGENPSNVLMLYSVGMALDN